MNQIKLKGDGCLKKLRKQFLKLLSIHGVSGEENNVRKYLKPVLEYLLDDVFIDDYGNLLGEKKYGDGKGATILLSAHMDTVKGVEKDRKINEVKGKISSSVGALGADDRAGIAIILTVLRNMNETSFNGIVKVAFSREEEIGCIGSSNIDTDWYADDTDLAIVVDRRGNRDIVAGCGMAFCSNNVGHFLEEVSQLADMNWEATEGGISDAMTFAENGVNAVNLSAGYYNEHTSREYAVLSDMVDTVKFILQIFGVVNDFADTFGEVPEENEWSFGWNYYKDISYRPKYSYSKEYYEDVFGDDWIYAETFDEINGDVFVYEIGSDVVIQQGQDEIQLTREGLKQILNQLTSQVK